MGDFHVKKRSITSGYSGLFDSKNEVSHDVASNTVGNNYGYTYKFINNMLNIGLKDSIKVASYIRINTTLNNKDDFWVIAWESPLKKALSIVAKKRNNVEDVFNIRIFANARYDVSVDGNTMLTTEEGKVTPYIIVNHCADELAISGKAIDLCSGDLGASYLLVVDSSGKLVMVQE